MRRESKAPPFFRFRDLGANTPLNWTEIGSMRNPGRGIRMSSVNPDVARMTVENRPQCRFGKLIKFGTRCLMADQLAGVPLSVLWLLQIFVGESASCPSPTTKPACCPCWLLGNGQELAHPVHHGRDCRPLPPDQAGRQEQVPAVDRRSSRTGSVGRRPTSRRPNSSPQPRRAIVRIADPGRAVLAAKPPKVDLGFCEEPVPTFELLSQRRQGT